MVERFTCPCCGYKTLDEQSSWDICPICYWEDDPLQFKDVDIKGGANTDSLRQAQKNFMEFGACERSMLRHVRKPGVQDVRNEKWKPLCQEKNKR
ncbi:hydrolase [Clostridium putrefaciens]|uniref:Hydrolase n=1 Tax=Clostridium putrefaciens TaxID=99675 RepID=A0A381J9I4_9CLOT|nr:CPCC family cysteine-rich protein [Clostridium putrefaciens]SUY47673.1 hydrolase [Clostridium putrefaciens]